MNKAPAIITPERIVESTQHMGFHGHFNVELIHKPTGLLKRKLQFKNLITTAGLNWIGAGSGGSSGWDISFNRGSSAHTAVGTGTTTPTIGDTALVAQVFRTNSTGVPSISPTYGFADDYSYAYVEHTRVFLPGSGSGNLTEVGIFNASSGGTMWTRQLFKDEFGAPTTIIKTDDDELRITYQLRLNILTTTQDTTQTIKSVSRDLSTRAYDIDASGRWGATSNASCVINSIGQSWRTAGSGILYSASAMPAITATQTGTGTGNSTGSFATYTAPERFRDGTYIWNPGLGSLDIGSVIWGNSNWGTPPIITTINPAVNKTASERFTFVGRFSFGSV